MHTIGYIMFALSLAAFMLGTAMPWRLKIMRPRKRPLTRRTRLSRRHRARVTQAWAARQ